MAYTLALSEASKADYLVTGDKGGLLALARHHSTWIVSAREFVRMTLSGGQLTMAHDLIPVTGPHGLTRPVLSQRRHGPMRWK